MTTANEMSEDLLNDYLHATADLTREADQLGNDLRGAECIEKVEDLVATLGDCEEAVVALLKSIRKLKKAASKGVEL